MDKTPLYLISSFIALGAIANLARFFWDIPAIIGPIFLPGWTGAVLFIVLGLLAAWSFKSLFSSHLSDH